MQRSKYYTLLQQSSHLLSVPSVMLQYPEMRLSDTVTKIGILRQLTPASILSCASAHFLTYSCPRRVHRLDISI